MTSRFRAISSSRRPRPRRPPRCPPRRSRGHGTTAACRAPPPPGPSTRPPGTASPGDAAPAATRACSRTPERCGVPRGRGRARRPCPTARSRASSTTTRERIFCEAAGRAQRRPIHRRIRLRFWNQPDPPHRLRSRFPLFCRPALYPSKDDPPRSCMLSNLAISLPCGFGRAADGNPIRWPVWRIRAGAARRSGVRTREALDRAPPSPSGVGLTGYWARLPRRSRRISAALPGRAGT